MSELPGKKPLERFPVLVGDSVPRGAARVAAYRLNDLYRFSCGRKPRFLTADLGIGRAPFQTTLRQYLSPEISLSLDGCDTSETAVYIAAFVLNDTVKFLGNPLDTVKVRQQDWIEYLNESSGKDVWYFNPPYRRKFEEIRDRYRGMPRQSVLVPEGEDPTYYYQHVLPFVKGKINDNGYCFIRTPREPYWRNAVYRIARTIFDECYTIHNIVTHGNLTDKRTGRLLLVEHGGSERFRFTTNERRNPETARSAYEVIVYQRNAV